MHIHTPQPLAKSKLSFFSLRVQLPLAVLLFCLIISTANALFGYRQFKAVLGELYNRVTMQFSYTAASYINGDKISYWLTNGADGDWEETNKKLNHLTNIADLDFICLFVPGKDYTTCSYVFDTINAAVTQRRPLPLGHVESMKDKGDDYITSIKRLMMRGSRHTSYTYDKSGGHVTSAIPVYDSYNNIVAVLSVIKPMSVEQVVRVRFLHSTLATSLVCLCVFIVTALLLISVRLIRPILLLTYETSHFVEHGGTLTDAIKRVRGKGELSLLAKSVQQMSVDMNRYIADLTQMTAEKERLGAELSVAAQIQADMLPRVFPPFADHPEIELFASMDPAKEVGGDFYDFFLVDDDHFAVVVGDVSGKGVPASLFMVIAKTLIKNAALHSQNPAEIFMSVNNQLCENNDTGLFVTCWLGILNIRTGELRFADAGHTRPVVCQAGEFRFLDMRPNLMLAAMEGISYTEQTLMLAKGDRLFVYTDGVTEATNAQNELYGEERLLAALQKTVGLSSKKILAEVRKDIDGFVQNAPQFDDITMLELCLQ